MKKLATLAILGLLPLAGCATPYGYSSGAYAGYDPYFDSGYQGYERPMSYYGEADYGRPYGTAAYAGYGYGQQPYYGGGYSSGYAYPQSYSYGYAATAPVYYQQPTGYYSTYYGCGC